MIVISLISFPKRLKNTLWRHVAHVQLTHHVDPNCKQTAAFFSKNVSWTWTTCLFLCHMWIFQEYQQTEQNIRNTILLSVFHILYPIQNCSRKMYQRQCCLVGISFLNIETRSKWSSIQDILLIMPLGCQILSLFSTQKMYFAKWIFLNDCDKIRNVLSIYKKTKHAYCICCFA